MSEENKTVVKRFVSEYQTNHDESVLYELLSKDFVDHSAMPGLPTGREGVKALFDNFHTAFAEFTAEIRQGYSTLLFMPQYKEPMALRIMESSWDILRPYPEYPGRERWTDRIFYRGASGVARPLSEIWSEGAPWTLNGVAGLLQILSSRRLRGAMRLLLMERGEVLP